MSKYKHNKINKYKDHVRKSVWKEYFVKKLVSNIIITDNKSINFITKLFM